MEGFEVGLNAVAAPIYAADGTVVATIGVSGPTFRLPAKGHSGGGVSGEKRGGGDIAPSRVQGARKQGAAGPGDYGDPIMREGPHVSDALGP
jgi:hypothetical protein